MKAHLASNAISSGSALGHVTIGWVLLGLPALCLTRCVLTAVVPMVLHAVVPETVRVVMHLI